MPSDRIREWLEHPVTRAALANLRQQEEDFRNHACGEFMRTPFDVSLNASTAAMMSHALHNTISILEEGEFELHDH